MANPTTTGGSGIGSPTILEIMDLFKQLNPENQAKIMESGALSGLLGLPGLKGNPNNEGSTTPEDTEINPVDPAVVESGKTGFFSKARDKAKDGLKDLGKSFKDPNGIGSNAVNMGVDLASAKMNEGLKNSEGFDMANGALSTIADAGKGTWVGYAASAAQLGLNAFNSATAKETEDFSIDSETREKMGGAYSGSYSDMDEAASLTGKYGGTNKKAFKEALEKIGRGKQMDATILDIKADNESRQAMAGNVQLNLMRRALQLNGGIDFTQLRAAKQGIKLNNINRVKNLKLKSKVNVDTKSIESVKEFKKGGNIDFVPIINDNPIKVTTKFVPIISDEIVIFKDGGKSDEKLKNRTIEELIEYAKELNPRFILRMSEPLRYIRINTKDEDGKESWGHATHEMNYRGNEVFPMVQEINGKLHLFDSEDDAYDNAKKTNNILTFDSEDEAKLFAISGKDKDGKLFGYKLGWLDFFELSPVEIKEEYSVNRFKDGNKTKLSKEVLDFYKDYDLSNINVFLSDSPRTEGNNIYISNDEDAVHELWHYISQNKPNEIYKDYYDNLNDNRIVELGGDLLFINRLGDPGIFYHPSELEARIKSAKYKTKGLTYTKEFFKELRKTPEKYGYNMRDLLYMYNDENLEKIFNLKQGGTIKDSKELVKLEETTQKNVIPEGALHKNKHHIENTEGLTLKGIPVIDNDGEQQAEIELDEIIFTLEVTKKLEELHKIYKEGTNKERDEAAIEAGKLLVQEILYNTDDRTGLISKCKKGGKLNGNIE